MKLPKIVGDVWFNSKHISQEDLAGKAILVDFWTYSCVNCLRTLPYLKKWWQRYQGYNFVIIGIHTPEFEFEKDPKNVEKAIKDLGVKWPIVLDNDYVNWNNFSNHYWPAKYLADQNGNIVYEHFGEGKYAETEKEIQKLLGEAQLPQVEKDEHTHGAVCFIPTPETYCGYARGHLSNGGGYCENQVFNYQKPGEFKEDSIALSGKFYAKPEYIESAEVGAALFLHFRATEVNLILYPVDKTATVSISLNDEVVPKELKGKDLANDSQVLIEKPAMYNLLKSDDLTVGILAIRAKVGQFRAYAFTFSGCSD